MFAYVPGALYQGPSSTPAIDGLAALGSPSFSHRYFVNATPNVYDVDFGRTPDSSGAAQTGSPNWRSILIGGLGKGGRSYYAIDVTDPASMAAGNETALAGKVLWEFSDADLGFSYGEPIVTKTRKYGWVVIFVSGYNNTDGQGYFFIVNPRTGALLEKVATGLGSPTDSAGLAHVNAFVYDASDGTADAAYAGDLLGNVWRLDLTTAAGTAYPAPTRIAVLADGSGTAQPVTSRPSIEVHPTTKKRFVMVGTGRLLGTSDIASTQRQTFYVIVDGNNARFNRDADLPSGITFPVGRARLAQNTTPVTAGITFDPLTQMGWYEELGAGDNGIGWRVTSDSATFAGSVAWAATLPDGSVCNPSGSSRVYTRDFAGASTTVLGATAAGLSPVAFVTFSGTVTDLRYLSVGGKARLLSGTDLGSVTKVDISAIPGLSLRRLNWRELPIVE
jgi:type IV pilus assembly protein PilY1